MLHRPDTQRLIELQKFLLQFEAIERFVRNPNNTDKRENDAEHSYHLAMAAWFLAPHFGLDRDKTIRIALAHDLVEVHAGDTFAFGADYEIAGKDAREKQAFSQLRSDWPDFPEMLESIQDYKDKASDEARFVYALDKVMPAILNYLGKGYTWHKHNVTMDQFQKEKERKIPKESPIYHYYEELLALLKEKPEYFHTQE